MKLLRACAAVAVLCLGADASAATYYVATNGNVTFDGSSFAPWRTLQHAVQTIAPGDTILVRAGTYAGCRIRLSGTQAAPKTLAREPGATVVINTPGPQNSHQSLIEIEAGTGSEVTDWIVDGFEVANSPHHGVDIRITNRITVRNCWTWPARAAVKCGSRPRWRAASRCFARSRRASPAIAWSKCEGSSTARATTS